jgi:NAD(P)-dependent dehydrogenase (short-subunit alcohol dehydrogenase family)
MKNIVITGSTRGIGFHMGLEFLKHGCKVTFSGRCPELPEQLEAIQAEHGASFLYVPCDVRRMDELQNLWDRSREKWGTVDIWINNAGKNAPHEFVYNTAPSIPWKAWVPTT